MTINGTNFGSSPTVKFNGTAATSPTVNGAGTQITATVPAGATTGKITVEVAGQTTATSATDFTVTVAGAPAVSLSPTGVSGLTNFVGYASASTNYTVTGTNLGGTNLVVTASTNAIEVSTNSSTGFTNTLTLAPAGDGTLTNTLWVRVSAVAPSGAVNASVTHVSGTASNTLTVAGTATTPALTLSLSPTAVNEDAGAAASTGTVGIPFSRTNDLTVTLTSTNTAAATVPASVVISSGQTNATFAIAAVANTNSFANQTAVISASATNYTTANATLTVNNVDVPQTTYISLTNTNANSYTQNFDSLGTTAFSGAIPGGSNGAIANLGPVMGLSSLNGWYGKQVGGTTTTASSVSPDTGSGNSGALLNYGASAATDRALGCLASGGRVMAFGALIKNDTGGVLNGIKISLKGEFWRSSTSVTNKLTFGYGLVDGTVVTTGNFLTATANGLSSLNIVGPAPVASSAALDGNLPANQVSFTDIYVGAALPVGAVLFVRWTDNDDAGNDAGLAVDDLQITASTGPLPADGLGIASLANGDTSFNSLPMWVRASTNQILRLSILGTATSGTISGAEISLPSAFTSGLSTSNIRVEGAGGGSSPVTSLVSNVLTVSGLAADNLNAATLVISNLAIPQTAGSLTNDGNYIFAVKTQTGEGALQAIANSPVAYVTIPMAHLGDVDTNGISLDVNKTVALEGVCTEENFNSSSSTSAYLQNGQPDGTNKAGINVYSALRNLFVRSNNYVVLGSVLNYSGLTEVVITNASNVLNLGLASNQPTPVTLTIEQLTNAQEAYEGSLVRVVGLSKQTNGGTWAYTTTTNTNGTVTTSGGNIILQNGGTNLTTRLNVGSTATTEPIYPAGITGIYGQFVAAAPFIGGGQIQPRDQADIEDAAALVLTLDVGTIAETDTGTAATLTIARTAGTTGAVSGSLTAVPGARMRVAGELTDLSSAYSFTILDGQASISVALEVIDDSILNSSSLVTLTGSATGLLSGSASLTIVDDETAPPIDTTPPVITLNGDNPVTVLWGLTWIDDYSAFDAGDNASVTVNRVNPVNTKVPGNYTVTYTATDSKSNTATATRTVNVRFAGGGTNRGPEGLPDAVRFALGADGTNRMDSALMPTSVMSNNALVLNYHGRPGTTPVELVPVVSTDLANSNSWTTSGIIVTNLGPTNVNGVTLDRRQASVPTTDGTRKFLRLRATTSQ